MKKSLIMMLMLVPCTTQATWVKFNNISPDYILHIVCKTYDSKNPTTMFTLEPGSRPQQKEVANFVISASPNKPPYKEIVYKFHGNDKYMHKLGDNSRLDITVDHSSFFQPSIRATIVNE